MKTYHSFLIISSLLVSLGLFAEKVEFSKDGVVKVGNRCRVGSVTGIWKGSPCEKIYGALVTGAAATAGGNTTTPVSTTGGTMSGSTTTGSGGSTTTGSGGSTTTGGGGSTTTTGGGGGGCFVAGTQVKMADGSLKNIEDVEVGEQLKDGKGKSVTVQSLKRYPTNNAKYSINGGAYFFTANHPFLTTEGWKSLDPKMSKEESPGLSVSKMKAGDILIREFGVEVILVLDSIATEEIVYNFTVNDSHEYIADGYVVHNLKAPDAEMQQ